MKYIDADKLVERLEEMKRAEYENCGGVNSKTGALQEVQELIDSLQQEQPSLPSGLDEAAGEYSERFWDGRDKLYAFHGFRAGAQWRDAQISKLPSNLDKAADKFAVLYDQGTCDGIAQDCFKAGAEWMAEQGVTEEYEVDEDGIFLDSDSLGLCLMACPPSELGCKERDILVIQMRKKQ